MALTLPTCALACLASAANLLTCSDVACMCENSDYQAVTTACIVSNCTIREALYTKNVTATECHIAPTVITDFLPIMVVVFILGTITILLRILVRILGEAKFWWDDLANFLAYVTATSFAFLAIAKKSHGLGISVWAIPQEDISGIFQMILIGTVIYAVTRTLIRFSIAIFYLRIFRTPAAKKMITWYLAINVALVIVLFFAFIFQCTPVSLFWEQWDNEHPGHCIETLPLAWFGCVAGIVLDIWMFVLPLPYIARLQLPLRKKIYASSMFLVGIIVFGLSIAKLPFIKQTVKTTNPSIDVLEFVTIISAENYLGVVCACMPALQALFKLPQLKRHRKAAKNISSTGTNKPINKSTSSADCEHSECGQRDLRVISGIQATTTVCRQQDQYLPLSEATLDPHSWNDSTGHVRATVWA